ncbi:MAG TPA: sulfite exporter TauE/SafE family protein [Thermoanaerobaculia bacterium]|nr:sulfite exporter TauE/SafE family protein [Thermoanaerobaculia bacterium]
MGAGEIVAMVAASVVAGVMNAMAGGGTIVSFPTLVLLGEPAITANATSTVALLPGVLASMFGYRREVETHRQWLKTLVLPSVLGGALGSVLLLSTPEKIFAGLAPLLVLFATLLFIVQGITSRGRKNPPGDPSGECRSSTADERPPAAPAAGEAAENGSQPRHIASGRWTFAILLQFGIAVYGGYFGAAIGILMLAVLGFLGLSDIHAMNGLKNFFTFCINGVAAAYFIVRGVVVWPVALIMMAGSIAGGYGGALFARAIGKEKARAAVVVIGLLVTAVLVWQRQKH